MTDSPQAIETAPAAQPVVDPRMRALEQELATRDRQIAAVRNQIDASHPPQAGMQPQPAAQQPPTAPAAALPPIAPAPPSNNPDRPIDTASSGGPAAAEAVGKPAMQGEPPAASAAGATASPGAAAATEARLANAQKRIAKLEQQLSLEVMRRQEVEAEMSRLLDEASAGPYEQAPNVVEKHLRRELDRARKEIRDLRSTLLSERRERDALERRFAALEKQAQAVAAAPQANAVPNEEIEALKERQRRVLASIQQDLAASKQRETELQAELERSQGAEAVSAAAAVSDLRAENSALQLRLDEEHQRNRDLAAKLQTATRVTDLIYKMQSGPVQGVAAVPLPAE